MVTKRGDQSISPPCRHVAFCSLSSSALAALSRRTLSHTRTPLPPTQQHSSSNHGQVDPLQATTKVQAHQGRKVQAARARAVDPHCQQVRSLTAPPCFLKQWSSRLGTTTETVPEEPVKFSFNSFVQSLNDPNALPSDAATLLFLNDERKAAEEKAAAAVAAAAAGDDENGMEVAATAAGKLSADAAGDDDDEEEEDKSDGEDVTMTLDVNMSSKRKRAQSAKKEASLNGKGGSRRHKSGRSGKMLLFK